jgi:hypothetical protein
MLGYGGSESMEGPKTRWTKVARACVASLGLSSGLVFPREVYGVDRLVTGDPVPAE